MKEELKIDYEKHMHEEGALNPDNVDGRHLINNPFEIDPESMTPDREKNYKLSQIQSKPRSVSLIQGSNYKKSKNDMLTKFAKLV